MDHAEFEDVSDILIKAHDTESAPGPNGSWSPCLRDPTEACANMLDLEKRRVYAHKW